MPAVYSISLGCPKNRVDTEQLLGVLGDTLHTAATPSEAEIVLVNTCSFIQPAIEESVRTILETLQDAARAEPSPVFVVAGCLVSRFGAAELARELPEVDLWLATHELDCLGERLALLLEGRGLTVPATLSTYGPRALSTGPSFAYLKISEGCRHSCAFCAIPSIRGPLRSAPPEEVQADAAAMLAQGVKELVVVAQDVTAYGRDLDKGVDLRRLLDRLLDLDGLARLRLMYLYPAGLTDELLAYLAAAGPPFVPYFDVPLQHAHPEVLQSMGRPFAKDPRLVVDRIRSHFPEAALRTSLIVGYPTERRRHFNALLDFVAEARFHHLGVFPFWPEEGTRAGLLEGGVTDRTKKKRRDEVMALQAEISEELLSEWEGEETDVVVDAAHDEWPGLHVGRTWFQAPEVDGVTYISGPGVSPGAVVRARVEEAKTYDLVAMA